MLNFPGSFRSDDERPTRWVNIIADEGHSIYRRRTGEDRQRSLKTVIKAVTTNVNTEWLQKPSYVDFRSQLGYHIRSRYPGIPKGYGIIHS